MLTIFQRHVRACGHRSEGRKYRRCRCPIWVDGMLHGIEIRKSLEMRDWNGPSKRYESGKRKVCRSLRKHQN